MDHLLSKAPSSFSRPSRSHSDSNLIHVPKVQVLPRVTGGLKSLYSGIRNGTKQHQGVEKMYTSSSGCFLVKPNIILGGRYKIQLHIQGGGQSAVLVKAQDCFNKMELVVIKVMHTTYFHVGLKEVQTLMRLRSADPRNVSHTIKLLNSFMFGEHICLVFPFLNPCSLTGVISKRKFSRKQLVSTIKKSALHLLSALAFLKQQNTIHADVKPQNILIEQDDDLDSVTLIDFGNAIHHTHVEVSLYYNDFELQTPTYRAPEVHLGNPFGVEIDMWSMGCVLLELYIGKAVFAGSNRIDMLKKMTSILGPLPLDLCIRGKFASEVESNVPTADRRQKQESGALRLMSSIPEIKDYTMASFLSGLLSYHPDKRLTPWEALQHPFMTSEICIAHFLPDSTQNTDIITKSDYNFKQKISTNVHRLYPSTFDLLRVGTSDQMFSESSKVAKIRPLGCDVDVNDSQNSGDGTVDKDVPCTPERIRKKERMSKGKSRSETKVSRTFISHQQNLVFPLYQSEPQEKSFGNSDCVKDETCNIIPGNHLHAQCSALHSSTTDIDYNMDKNSEYMLPEGSDLLEESVSKCTTPDKKSLDRMIDRHEEKKILRGGNLDSENEPVVQRVNSSSPTKDVLNCSTRTYVVDKDSIFESRLMTEVKCEDSHVYLSERGEKSKSFSNHLCVNSNGKRKRFSYTRHTEQNIKDKQRSDQTAVKGNSIHSHSADEVMEFCHNLEETTVCQDKKEFHSPRITGHGASLNLFHKDIKKRDPFSKVVHRNDTHGRNLLRKNGRGCALHSGDYNSAPEDGKERHKLNTTFTLEYVSEELEDKAKDNTVDTCLPEADTVCLASFCYNDGKQHPQQKKTPYFDKGSGCRSNSSYSIRSNKSLKARNSDTGHKGQFINWISIEADENGVKNAETNTGYNHSEKKIQKREQKNETECKTVKVENFKVKDEDKIVEIAGTNLLQGIKDNGSEVNPTSYKPTYVKTAIELSLGRADEEKDIQINGNKYHLSVASTSVKKMEHVIKEDNTECVQTQLKDNSGKSKKMENLAHDNTEQRLKKSESDDDSFIAVPKTSKRAVQNLYQFPAGEHSSLSEICNRSYGDKQNKAGSLKSGKSLSRGRKRRTCSKKLVSYKCMRISTLYTDKYKYQNAQNWRTNLQKEVKKVKRKQTGGSESTRNSSNVRQRNTKNKKSRGPPRKNSSCAKYHKSSDCSEREQFQLTATNVKAVEENMSRNKSISGTFVLDKTSELIADKKNSDESEMSLCGNFDSPLNVVYATISPQQGNRNKSVKDAGPVIGTNFNLCLSGKNVHQISANNQHTVLQKETDKKTQENSRGKSRSAKQLTRAKSQKRALSFLIVKSPNRDRLNGQELNSPCHLTQSGNKGNVILKVCTPSGSTKTLSRVKGVKKRLILQTSSTSLNKKGSTDPYEFIVTPGKCVTGSASSKNPKCNVNKRKGTTTTTKHSGKRRQSTGKKLNISSNHIYSPAIGIFDLVEKKTRQLMINVSTVPNKIEGTAVNQSAKAEMEFKRFEGKESQQTSAGKDTLGSNLDNRINHSKPCQNTGLCVAVERNLPADRRIKDMDAFSVSCTKLPQEKIPATKSSKSKGMKNCYGDVNSEMPSADQSNNSKSPKRNLPVSLKGNLDSLPISASSQINQVQCHKTGNPLEQRESQKHASRKRSFEQTEDMKLVSVSSCSSRKLLQEAGNDPVTKRKKDVDQSTKLELETLQPHQVDIKLERKFPVFSPSQLACERMSEKTPAHSYSKSKISASTVTKEIAGEEEILLLD